MSMCVRLLLSCLACFVLISCGGGGGPVTASPPATPTGLTAIAGHQQVSLSWTASSTATVYHVRRAANSGGPYTEIATPTATHWTDSGLANGTPVFYVVTAASSAGESAPTAEVAATPSGDLPLLPGDDTTRNYLGMNTWFLSDWDGSFAFVDAMKHARPWRDGNDWNQQVGLDADGWPTADASTVIFTGSPAQINGTYKLMFAGQADVSLLWAAGAVSNQSYDAVTNTTTADVSWNISNRQSSGLIFLNTRRTAISTLHSGISQVRLYRPGYPADGSAVFTTPFLHAMSKARVVRMMDWTFTNNNLAQGWEQRITPRQAVRRGPDYTGPGGTVWDDGSELGVALEHQIQLCNILHVDCWINVPPAASDEFVQKMALALRYGTDGEQPYTSLQEHPIYPPLDAGLHLYLEYANEIWNFAGGFYSFPVVLDRVRSLPPDHVLTQYAPAGANEYQLLYMYPAWRMATISDIFRSVYGDASMMNRVRPVLMTQQGDANGSLSLPLNWLHDFGAAQLPARAVASWLYGAGGSAYYGVNTPVAELDRGNADLFFAAGNYPDTQMLRAIGHDAVLAANFGLKRIAYEGGPSLDFYSSEQGNAINLDARMQDMIVRTHDAWSANGGDLLVYYTLVGHPSWEFTPDMAISDSPKLRGLDALNTRPRAAVTLGQALPGTLIASTWGDARIRTGYDYWTTCDSLSCLGGNDAGEWIALPGHASAPYQAALAVNALSATGATIRVWVNGIAQGQVTLPAAAGLADSSSLPIAIPAGLVVVRLEVVSGGFNLYSIKLPVLAGA